MFIPLVKAASICGFGHLAHKRSRSSEGLNAIAESTEAGARSASPARPSREASPARKSPKSLRKRVEVLEAKESARKVAPSDHKKETDTKRTTPSPIRDVSVSPRPGEETSELPKGRQRGILRLFDRSRSKSPSPTPSSEDSEKEVERSQKGKKKKVAAESPKIHDQTHFRSTHPLSVAKQAETSTPLHPEACSRKDDKTVTEQTVEEHPPESVADIVKRLDPQQLNTEASGNTKQKEKTKEERKSRGKEKQHPSREESKEKGSESKSSRLRSFFKSKKSYDVSKASSQTTKTSSSPKLKKKKARSERELVQRLSENPPLSLQHRIERLKELGVGMDTDGSEMVLSLEELRELEARSGILLGEEKDEEEGVGDAHSRSVSPEYSVESRSSYSRSVSPVDSGSRDQRSQSRASTGAATWGSSRGVSPIEGDWREGMPSGEEDDVLKEEETVQVEPTASVIETVRQLEPLSAARSVSAH